MGSVYFFDLSGESNKGRECSYAAGKNFAHAMEQMDGVNHVDVVDESVISFDFGCDPKKRRMRRRCFSSSLQKTASAASRGTFGQ